MMKTLLRLAARNAWRNRVRTLLTAGMVVLGVSLLLLGLSWIDGVFNNMIGAATGLSGHVRLVKTAFAEREELMPLYEHLEDVEALAARVANQPGVVAAHPRMMAGVTVTAGEEIGDHFALVMGAPEAYYREWVGAKDALREGAWFTGGADELVIGATVAQETGARTGSELVLLGLTQDGSLSPIKGTVVGIVSAGNAFVDRHIFAPLAKIQWLADTPGAATELLVFTDVYRRGEDLAARLRDLADLEAITVQAWNEREPWVSMLGAVEGIRGAIVFVIVFLAALGIWNTMMMSVLERTHEIGVLRAMGLTRLGTIGLFVVEAVAIAVGGGLVGVGLGSIPAWLLETRGIHIGEEVVANMSAEFPIQATMYGDLSLSLVVMSFIMGLVMAFIGSFVPALRAASIEPVTAMRSGR